MEGLLVILKLVENIISDRLILRGTCKRVLATASLGEATRS